MQKTNDMTHIFCGACTDCYILYRATRYLIAFLGIFIFVGCVTVGAVFADLCNKKETVRKNPTVSRQFYCTGDIIRIIPISCKKPLCRRAILRHSGLFVFGCGLPHPSIAAFAYPDGHRLHDAAAVGGTVAGFFVHMKAGQAHKILCSSCTRSPITMGLDKKPSMPLSNALRRSSSNALAVMARIGSFARAGSSSARIVRVAV